MKAKRNKKKSPLSLHFKEAFSNKAKKENQVVFNRAGEPANFFPAPDFFFKRLRLLIFSQAAPAPAPGFF